MTQRALKTIVRIWKDQRSPILIFPYWRHASFMAESWEPIGLHGGCDARGIIPATRAASDQEALKAMRAYEAYYRCHLQRLKRLPARFECRMRA